MSNKPESGFTHEKIETNNLLMVVLIAAFFVLREHWGHIAGSWPYLLLLACPVMHLFHRHGGHGPRTEKE